MDRDQRIERYIQGKMTAGERREFESMVKKDSSLAEELKFLTDLRRILEEEDVEKTRQMVSSFELEARETSPKSSIFTSKWLVAASTLLIVSLSFLFLYDPSLSPREIYDENFQPYPNEVVAIVRGTGQEDERVAAFAAYQNEEFENAVVLFEHLKIQDPDPVYDFYQANALLQLNRAGEALPLLRDHGVSGSPLADRTDWYLAMAYLQLNEPENAIGYLRQVVSKNEYQAKEAGEILEELE